MKVVASSKVRLSFVTTSLHYALHIARKSRFATKRSAPLSDSANKAKVVSRAVRQYKVKPPTKTAPQRKSQVDRLKSELAKCHEQINDMRDQLHVVQVLSYEPILSKMAGEVLAQALLLDSNERLYSTRFRDQDTQPNAHSDRVHLVLEALGDRSAKFRSELDRLVGCADGTDSTRMEQLRPRVQSCLKTFGDNPRLMEELPVQYRVFRAFTRRLGNIIQQTEAAADAAYMSV